MRSNILGALMLALLVSCGTSEPARVAVMGAPEDLAPLTGEWVGSYESSQTGATGSITFHLTDDPKGAHGDVLFIAPQTITYPQNHNFGSEVLSIEFVRIAGGEISGRIVPYTLEDETLETWFAGHVKGDRIEGTFVAYSDRNVSPRRGTWKVRRARY